MLLKRLELENIRSYSQSTIDFSSGTTLLAGDIGSGKSTILLAIEFALFGASRTDLPGEALLRKGCLKAFVELSFELDDLDIVVRRELKKDKKGVKQLAGFLSVNGVRKELTPVELKAEVISLLGYPEEFITKNKNYIFRYTIYTPQEEMKQVLSETPEMRLDLLRKIFNIDKYKVIRENLQVVLKEMRTRIAVFKTKLEPMDEKKLLFSELLSEIDLTSSSLDEVMPQKVKQEENLKLLERELTALREEDLLQQKKKQDLETTKVLLEEGLEQQQKLSLEIKDLEVKLQEFEEVGLGEEVSKKLLRARDEREGHLMKQTHLKGKVVNIQQRIQELQGQINQLNSQTILLEEKQQKLQVLKAKADQNIGVEEKLEMLERLFTHTNNLIAKNNVLTEQSQEIHSRLKELKACPTCLQDVNERHKSRILSIESEKMSRADQLLLALQDKLSDIMEQKAKVLDEQAVIRDEEKERARLSLEIKHLLQRISEQDEVKLQLRSFVQENNLLQNQLRDLPDVGNLDHQILVLQKKQEKIFLRESFLERVANCQDKLTKSSLRQEELRLKIDVLNKDLVMAVPLVDQIKKLVEKISGIREQVVDFSVKVAEFQTKREHLLKNKEVLERELLDFKEMEKNLIEIKEKYHWLDKHFIPLTITIEKHVMTQVYLMFNHLFKEWFSLLIEDDCLNARLDDSFTPIIEQNGYEILFGNLSGGERTSAALAYRLALNKVINDVVSEINTKDLLILDEPTDGFSSQQLDKVREVLDILSLRQVLIVSHEEKVESFVSHVIRVRKEDGESVVTT